MHVLNAITLITTNKANSVSKISSRVFYDLLQSFKFVDRNRDLGKSANRLSTTSGNMRGRDAGGVGNDDDGGAEQEQPGERRAVAISGPAVQERTVGGQTAERLGRPGTRRPSERAMSPAPIAARVSGVYVGRLEREHPEGDIETVTAQPVPVGAQQGVQRAEQRGQRRVPGGRFAAAAKPPSPPAAEHGQVAVGERDRPVVDLAGGVERVAARFLRRRRQDVVSALPDTPGPGVCAQLWRGPHSGRSHQARVPGG